MSSSEFAIERGSIIARPTFGEFKASYRRSRYRPHWFSVLAGMCSRPWYATAFLVRIRVPDGSGSFGPDAKDARWCWPWQWYRLYYAARFPCHQKGDS